VESQDPVYDGSRYTYQLEASGKDVSRFTSYLSRFALTPSRLADLGLLTVALIWGATFVMVKNAVAAYPVLSFLALRFAFAALALLPVLLLRRARRRANGSDARSKRPPTVILGTTSSPHDIMRAPREASARHSERVDRDTLAAENHQRRISYSASQFPILAAPLLMGLALFAGYALQTFGLRLTTPAKAGFITGLSVVIVPVVSTLALRQRLSRGVWLGVGLATAGLALLSLQVADPERANLSVSPGDLLVLGCAVAFACQILLTGRFAPSWDPLLLTFGQIVVVMVTAGIAALLLESPPAPGRSVLFAAAFTGILATSLAFGIQTVAQRFTSPTRTALVFATEPVFAALFSFLLIGEVLGPRQLVGCALILAGMITAESLRTGSTTP
jgi:drug/metabolite transporter (DMT)-like permease